MGILLLKSEGRQGLRLHILAALWVATLASAASAETVAADFSGERPWIGPGYFANPLQDFELAGGKLHARSEQAGFVSFLDVELADRGAASIDLVVQMTQPGDGKQKATHRCGVRLGVKGLIDDWRTRSVYPQTFTFFGIDGVGTIHSAEATSTDKLDPSQPVTLKIDIAPAADGKINVTVTGSTPDGKTASASQEMPSDRLAGGMSILAGKTGERLPIGSNAPYWSIASFKADGDRIQRKPERTFGPIFWTQYTLSRRTMKMSVQMPPLGADAPRTVRLQENTNGEWKDIGSADIDKLACNAIVRVDNWDDTKDHSLRAAYTWQGTEYTWPCTVRKDPRDQPTVSVVLMNCDNGYTFPQPHIQRNLAIQNPDLLFYAGDQIYEAETGKFGVIRDNEFNQRAVYDYLRKWHLFGWANREIMRDRPTVAIPDDHDIFQGNFFGNEGRQLAQGARAEFGGVVMHPDWVNMMQRTQTGNLPDPVDPAPVQRGIGVYFTDMLYGGLNIAVLEDRKWKPGPDGIWKSKDNPDGPPLPDPKSPKDYDLPGLQLLGPRQEAFLNKWADSDEGDFHVAFAQNPMCHAASNFGWKLEESVCDFDSNSWPQTARNRAVKILGRANAVSLHGDQHFGILARLGADTWDDGPISFLAPGSANGYPRAWWPKHPGDDREPGAPDNTGKYIDDFGNKMNILAVADPDYSTADYDLGWNRPDPEKIADIKGSGYGLAVFNRQTRDVTFNCYRVLFDADKPTDKDQFVGFPHTVKVPKK